MQFSDFNKDLNNRRRFCSHDRNGILRNSECLEFFALFAKIKKKIDSNYKLFISIY